MRDLAMLGAMLLMLPMALRSGMVAFLLWGYFSLIIPTFYMYGFMQDVRYVLIFAIIAIFHFFVNKDKMSVGVKWQSTAILSVIFVMHGLVCATFGFEPNVLNFDRFIYFSKAIAFCLLMPYFLNSRWRIHVFLVMIALGLGVHGVIEGLKYVVSLGGHRASGIPASSLSDNNLFAVGMVMVIPIMIYLSQYTNKKIVSFGYSLAAIITLLCVLGTNSRGGFLGVAAVGGWLFLTSRKKMRAMAFILVGAIAVAYLAPDAWFDRMATIGTASEDSSFMGRVAAWKISSAIALANPFFGGGFHAVQIQWIWDYYRDAPSLFPYVSQVGFPVVAKASHSIYFQVLGDMGFVGLALYLIILANAFFVSREIRRLAKSRKGFEWAVDLANLIGVALVAYMVSGAGVGLAYFELPWILMALLGILRQMLISDIDRIKMV